MKPIVKKIVKVCLLFLISSIILYITFTLSAFHQWCTQNQISMSKNSDELLQKLDPEKIQELGDTIHVFKEVIENEHNDLDEKNHTIGEYYDPLGFSVWAYLNQGIQEIIHKYTTISILLGIAITSAYIVITNQKLNQTLKISLGYFGVIAIVPPIYMYSWTGRFWNMITMYGQMPKYFYILYTIIFIVMYGINYKIGKKMTKELNKAMCN